jgi:hypothetical protein
LKFSLAEFVLAGFVLWLLTYTIYSLMTRNFLKLAGTFMCLAGLIWFGFIILCGINYHRETFARQNGLNVRPSSAQELAALCAELGQRTSEDAAGVNRSAGGGMLSRFTDSYEAAAFAPAGYAALGEVYPGLGGFCTRPKPVAASLGLSVAELVGVYFPFTFEANFNRDVPAYVAPSSMMHELAHFKGYMREDEANFIAYLACLKSGSDEFAYSGAMLALRHSLNALYEADPDAYFEAHKSLHPGIISDYAANGAYWKRFEGPVAEVSQKVNDVYLRTNRQEQGVKSYGQMVDLLLAERRAGS